MATESARGSPRRPDGAITFHRPVTFWAGVVAIGTGVILQFPDYLASADMHYRMAGMPMSGLMCCGMSLILVGTAAALRGLWQPGQPAPQPVAAQRTGYAENTRLRPAHWALAGALTVALVIDTMKPATLGFVLPGMAAEYHISMARVALLPIVALSGTTVGSVLWGVVADRVGRRSTVLSSGLLFMATSVCGFMPDFQWNLAMCLIMGAAAGGLLPTAYTLMAETMPAAARGWLIVLQTGVGAAGGYLIASTASALLQPHFGWRLLWVLGLPTGLILLLVNRWIPESPRFLLAVGRSAEARRVAARFGGSPTLPAAGLPMPAVPLPMTAVVVTAGRGGIVALLRPPYRGLTATILCYGLAWGLVNWGVITFLPTFLAPRGAAPAGHLLTGAALIAFPNSAIAALLYSKWSSRRAMVLYALVTAAGLAAAALAMARPGAPSWRLLVPVVVVLIGSGGMIAMLAPYTAELYPTRLRARGSGLAAAAGKSGGIIAPILVTAVGATFGARLFTALAAIPVAAAAGLMHLAGRETSGTALPEAAPDRWPEVPEGVTALTDALSAR